MRVKDTVSLQFLGQQCFTTTCWSKKQIHFGIKVYNTILSSSIKHFLLQSSYQPDSMLISCTSILWENIIRLNVYMMLILFPYIIKNKIYIKLFCQICKQFLPRFNPSMSYFQILIRLFFCLS